MVLQNNRCTIVHCIDSLALGGSELLLKETLPLLKNYNNIVCYLHPPENLMDGFKDYPLYCLHFNSKLSFFSAAKKLTDIIKRHDVSAVHAHLFYSTLIARFACPKHIKLIFTVHSLLSKDAFEINSLSLLAEKLTYSKKQTIIGVSQQVLADYDKWIGIQGKSFVLHNYVNEAFFKLSFEPQPLAGNLKLVAVGNLKRAKNYSTLLDAMALLKEYPITLDIYGTGDLEQELQSKITKNRLNVRLMGSATDVSKVLPCYHAYIMSSVYEGYGIAPMEAIAAGMPTLLSNLDVFKELVDDIPKYFDPQQAQSISDAIRYLYNNWDERRINAERGRSLVKKRASKEVYFNKLTAIYNELI
jgi:glycosyltransferase involved in cell wall biosynthesis